MSLPDLQGDISVVNDSDNNSNIDDPEPYVNGHDNSDIDIDDPEPYVYGHDLDHGQSDVDEEVRFLLDVPGPEVNPDEPPDDDDPSVHDESFDDIDYFSLFDRISQMWLEVELTHNVSKSASNAFWKIATTVMMQLFQKKEELNIRRKIPMFPNQRKLLYEQHTLPVDLSFVFKHNASGVLTKVNRTDKTPISRFPASEYTKLLEIGSMKVCFLIFPTFQHSFFRYVFCTFFRLQTFCLFILKFARLSMKMMISISR